MMHRNTIIAICAGFCAVAVIAGLFIGRLSSAGQSIVVAQTTPGAGAPSAAPTANLAVDLATNTPTATPEPLTEPTNALVDEPTSVPAPTAEAAAAEPTAAEATAEPAAEPTAAPAAEPTAAPVAAGFVEYTVQKGDELLALAKKFNVSAKEILDNNQIANPDSLVVGQILHIPQK